MADNLYNKYRPQDLDQVWGQPDAVATLERLLARGTVQCFMFEGPADAPGIGKTTMARIVARRVGATMVKEIDGASNTGVDEMRAVTETLGYKAFGGGAKAILIDECHRITANAWDASLKATEEPTSGVYWLGCTTNYGKLPKTVQSRFSKITLRPLGDEDLMGLLNGICEAEGIDAPEAIKRMCVTMARGSARGALSNLELVVGIDDRVEAARVLENPEETDGVINLCRFLCGPVWNKPRGSWQEAMKIVDTIDVKQIEGCRIVVMNYVGKVAKGAKNDKAAQYCLKILEAFAVPYNASEQYGPLMLSIGAVLLL